MKCNTNAPYGKEKNMEFYKKLSSGAKANYDFIEKKRPHSEEFKELMNRDEDPDDFTFTTEEQDLLGKEDLITFSDLFPDDAYAYMAND